MQKSIPSPDADEVPVRRGRPRGFDRAAALAKATRLFWEKGYEATSISDLTEALGIGAPSLYAAFGSKEALYTEALNYYCESNEALVWGRALKGPREAVVSRVADRLAVSVGTELTKLTEPTKAL